MTPSQRLVLEVVGHLTRDGWPTHIRAICEHTGHKSPSSVHAHIGALELLGLVETRGRTGTRLTAAGAYALAPDSFRLVNPFAFAGQSITPEARHKRGERSTT